MKSDNLIRNGFLLPAAFIVMLTAAVGIHAEEVQEAEDNYVFLEQDGVYSIHIGADEGLAMSLDDFGRGAGTNVELSAFTDTPDQYFQVIHLEEGSGFCRIVSLSNGLDLTVDGNTAENGQNIMTSFYTGNDNQQWRIILSDEGNYLIESKLGCFADNSGSALQEKNNIHTFEWTGDPAGQLWKFVFESEITAPVSWETYYSPAEGENLVNGNYLLVLAENTALCLGLDAGLSDAGSTLQIVPRQESGNFRVTINGLGDGKGSYLMRDADTGDSLDVDGASCLPGTRLQTWTFDNTPGQKWRCTAAENGCVVFVSALGTALGADSVAEGDSIYMVSPDSPNVLKFMLLPVA